ncbi:hypothetical protein FSP39_012043 [Pinctada imbricata]|uniref:Aminotransferase class I/classII large domain-containing protein n=1 Tax=Pinctada imbricata TaxID=66713 RepID=A0AA89C8Y4_PINIB|nr:hypothetical protein FSP39_012043 [Pinctada imbricata]
MAELVRTDLQNYAPASNLLFNEKIKNLILAGQQVYHFAFGQSPFPVVESAVTALKEYAGENVYLPVAGIPELRESICAFHARFDNLNDYIADDVIVGPGSKELIFLLMNVFSGDVIVISPSWTTYKPQARLAHHTPHVIKTSIDNEWKITPQLVEQFMASNKLSKHKLLVLNNPDNPSGTIYSESELRALSEIFRRHNIIVLSDEIYARLNYDQPHVSIAHHYPEGTVLSTGLSKWCSAGGWRLGYHIYPKELTPLKLAVRSAASHTYTSAPSPVQFAAWKMFQNMDECDDYIQHCSRILKAVGDYCHRELTSVGVKAIRPKSGYYIFPDFEILREKMESRGIVTCEDMCETLLQEASVAVMAGGPAFLRPTNELTTRLCYVPFDGGLALKASRALGLDDPLPDDFVKEFCSNVYDGIQALKNWVLLQLQ